MAGCPAPRRSGSTPRRHYMPYDYSAPTTPHPLATVYGYPR
jgi:hypothetical protein